MTAAHHCTLLGLVSKQAAGVCQYGSAAWLTEAVQTVPTRSAPLAPPRLHPHPQPPERGTYWNDMIIDISN